MAHFDFNEVNLNVLLRQCGYEPVYTKGDSSWYLSPFRAENTPSFQVRANVFHDWGDTSIRGGVLDLCSRLWDIPRSDTRALMQRLSATVEGGVSAFTPPIKVASQPEEKKEKVIGSYPMNNPHLIEYLAKRGVEQTVSERFTRVLVYLGPDREKKLFGIGFPNRSGGYELRSEFAKRSFAPKDISVISSGGEGCKNAIVFEGFIDALSYLSEKERQGSSVEFDCIVLNGVGLVRESINVLQNYRHAYGLLDNDRAGDQATEVLKTELPQFVDSRSWLGSFKDVNDKINSLRKSSEQKLSPSSPSSHKKKL